MKLPDRLPLIGRFTASRSATLVILLVAVLLAIALPLRNGFRIRTDVAAAKQQLADLNVLHPLYTELMSLEKPANWPALRSGTRAPLKESDVVDVPKQITSLAARASVELSAVSPRVGGDEDGTRWLDVEIRALAPYENLRHFLTSLVQLSSMERFERIELKRDFGREQAHIVVRLTLE
ncbi:MAG TPA: hypothetical protein PKC67_05250 [Kiritimatiellia bacterium]|nr:hypothetical protein [Kiritimatiellia bacterium]HMP33739.1 hypothetical protein [Kiritimatiellia bacterium]